MWWFEKITSQQRSDTGLKMLGLAAISEEIMNWYIFKVGPFPAPMIYTFFTLMIFHHDFTEVIQLSIFGVGIKLDANAWWFGGISLIVSALFGVRKCWNIMTHDFISLTITSLYQSQGFGAPVQSSVKVTKCMGVGGRFRPGGFGGGIEIVSFEMLTFFFFSLWVASCCLLWGVWW